MWNEDRSEEAQRKAKEMIGPEGRMLHPIQLFSMLPNSVLSTKQLGPFWYGDLDLTEDQTNIDELAVILGEEVVITSGN